MATAPRLVIPPIAGSGSTLSPTRVSAAPPARTGGGSDARRERRLYYRVPVVGYCARTTRERARVGGVEVRVEVLQHPNRGLGGERRQRARRYPEKNCR